MPAVNSETHPQLADFHSTGLRDFWLLPVAMLLTAMAAGTGWGIRGQYGHETGAMIAGTLASLTLVMLFIPGAMSLTGARAAAMMATAIGVGGSMTYGQTVGLTHDHEIVGNVEAWRWGMLGLFLKGGVWIGFGGLFLGMGLGGKRYRAAEMTMLLAGAVALFFLGVWLINSPFDPANKQLPYLYFSDHWQFEPERYAAGEIKPRYETFGGYWLALVGLILWVRVVRGDKLALRMAVFGIIGGGLGFSGGQCTQSAHAWHPEWFQEGGILGFGEAVFSKFNWWNIMETTFGMIWGATIAFGLWWNRRLINVPDSDERSIPAVVEILLAAMYLSFVLVGEFEYLNPRNLPVHTIEFMSTHPFDFVSYWYIEIGIVIVSLPLIGIAGGRMWPYLMLLLGIAVPICGKTMSVIGYSTNHASVWFENTGFAWYILVQVPLLTGAVIAAWLISNSRRHTAARFAAVSLAFTTLLYFGLNTAFFGFPSPLDPIEQWGGRHPSQLFFTISAACLLVSAVLTSLIVPGFVGKHRAQAQSSYMEHPF